ncbi:unnamed protein product [Spirodela intermedia]|uniref:Phospholipid-transporting ATPase n=1 Tax=Spirodela intermedia TaxID=51605 RepID=A0A7I8IA47_SPIIN|nr:unnamed protein product [Spirodela intermedia]CAA6654596.1 unnamed protein product [Spirodela intermedia]
MSSGEPLLSSSFAAGFSSPVTPATPSCGSFNYLCPNISFSYSADIDGTQSQILDRKGDGELASDKDEDCAEKQLKGSKSTAVANRIEPAVSQCCQSCVVECPARERSQPVSRGSMEVQGFPAALEISANPLQGEKWNKSRRKSAHFEDSFPCEENSRLIYINDPVKTNDQYEFTGNEICTSKYTVITFLPKNLFIQFHRVAYLYFLAIAALNQLPPLAVFGRTDGYEDWRRHRSDRKENNREAYVFQSDRFQLKKWKKIRAGEVVKVYADETMPCDMVLLGTSDPTGIAYIQTMNLDGESNLKTRYARQETVVTLKEQQFSGLIKCEQPNRNIYEFAGNMDFNGQRIPLGQSNIVLRGCQLKNVDWAVGVVVYAGQETKAMLNSAVSPSKRSKLEGYMNRETLWLSVFLFIMCAVVALGMGLWLERHGHQLDTLPYYRRRYFTDGSNNKKYYKYYGIAMEVFFSFLSSVIVFQIMIPISLYITMELVRLGQSYFMIGDTRMYDKNSNSRFQCRSLNINEDLGQIRYVFSDKTGTLTENKMNFRRASVFGKDYGKISGPGSHMLQGVSIAVIGRRMWKLKSTINVDLELVALLHKNLADEERISAHEFFLTLAACNTVIPILSGKFILCNREFLDEAETIDYQGESPDEQALVAAASAYGYTLIERTSGHIVVDVNGEELRLDVLGLHEFDSVRKRMSVVIRFPNSSVKVLVKGADSSMFSILIKTTERLMRDTEIWVLTGDKQETAISIGLSCKLLTPSMQQIIVNGTSEDECRRLLTDAISKYGIKLVNFRNSCPRMKNLQNSYPDISSNAKTSDILMHEIEQTRSANDIVEFHEEGLMGSVDGPLALVIDGNSLVYILEKDLEQELFDLATSCRVVICCRVAPLQKAGIVDLIKSRTNDMTLAIGDGANDVSMIQMADVGVGISGQEGRQAVMAADFAMGQFRFLKRLLLVHGHWNYYRVGYLVLYNFYRNAVFVLMLFWFILSTAFSTTSALTDWSSVFYSVIYTSVPTIVVGILDKDLSHRTLLRYPKLYCSGHRHESYNLRLFWITMLDTFWQSLVLFYVPLFTYKNSSIDIWSLGSLWTIAVVVLVNVHLAMDIQQWVSITHIATWGSIIITYACMVILDSIPIFPNYWTIYHLAKSETYWLMIVLITIIALLPRFLCKVVRQLLWPSDIQIAREAEILGKFPNHLRSSQDQDSS